jgi:alkylation response protein AidB-like acyl-CoA dehydrogenase
MTDATVGEHGARFRAELKAWLAANVPLSGATERSGLSVEERFAASRRWQKKAFDGGWVGIAWPKEYGGRAASLEEEAIYIEEMARAGAPPMANTLGLDLIGPTIIAYGTGAQKQRYLPKILSGDEIWCQGFSEPNAGSDLAGLRTDARLSGDHFLVNGQKIWTSIGWAADWCALVVRTDPGTAKHKGLSYLLVDMRSPGVQVKPLRQMTGESEFTELFFQDVRVPVENVLGQIGDGWNVALGTLMHEREKLGVRVNTAMQKQFERLVELAHTMERDGRTAAEDPVIRQKLAQSYVELEVMRLNQARAIQRASRGGVPGPEGSILKIFWSEANQRFQQTAQEILGPYGQLAGDSEYAPDRGQWAYSYLRARGNTIEAGTSEIQRNIIGHFVLGLPKSY